MAVAKPIFVAQDGVPFTAARLVEDGSYRVTGRLLAPKGAVPNGTWGPSPELRALGRSVRVKRFKLSSEDRVFVIDLDVASVANKAGEAPAPSSVSWELLIGTVAAAAAAIFIGPGAAAAIFALGFVGLVVEKIVRGDPGDPSDDLKPPGIKFGFGLGAALAVAGLALFLWKR